MKFKASLPIFMVLISFAVHCFSMEMDTGVDDLQEITLDDQDLEGSVPPSLHTTRRMNDQRSFAWGACAKTMAGGLAKVVVFLGGTATSVYLATIYGEDILGPTSGQASHILLGLTAGLSMSGLQCMSYGIYNCYLERKSLYHAIPQSPEDV